MRRRRQQSAVGKGEGEAVPRTAHSPAPRGICCPRAARRGDGQQIGVVQRQIVTMAESIGNFNAGKKGGVGVKKRGFQWELVNGLVEMVLERELC